MIKANRPVQHNPYILYLYTLLNSPPLLMGCSTKNAVFRIGGIFGSIGIGGLCKA